MAIIEVQHLTKEFQLGQLTNVRDTIKGIVARLQGRNARQKKAIKALDDVSFSIGQGEVVGIIGPNGAGKSTLLKILSGITKPTSGRYRVKGKVAPLIEVGAGLLGDLTGRENIYLNASILGLSRRDIKSKLEEIVEFAELQEFIDTPIKRYSSGMKIKLGFSIATAIESDILIVDEVLAVGDLAFQRKSFDRMEEIIRSQNRTVLLVSHNIRQIERMSKRVLLINHGRLVADGSPTEVTDLFYRQTSLKISEYDRQRLSIRNKIRATGEVDLVSLDIVDEGGHILESIQTGEQLRIKVKFYFKEYCDRPEIIIGTHTTDFIYLNASSTATLENRPAFPPGLHEIECIVPNYPLVAGTYCIRCSVLDKNGRLIYDAENIKTFRVDPSPLQARQPILKKLDLPSFWRIDGVSYGFQPNGTCGDYSRCIKKLDL